MKRNLIAASLLALASTTAFAADAGPWTVFVRAAHLSMENDDITLGTVEVEDKTIPDISVRYAFDNNFAAELLLTVPQKHNVKLGGADIGSFKHLPPTLFGQYHFDLQSNFKPYVGLGVNFTRITDVELAGGAGDLDSNSIGPAVQVGVDYKVGNSGYISVDVKKIYISSDVEVAGINRGKIHIDPTVFAVGYGFRF